MLDPNHQIATLPDNRSPATLSLDLDNLWSYMKTGGDPAWQNFPSYLALVVPRILEYLDRHNLKITFFIVGQDAVLEKNQAALSSIAQAGHEIANHSFHHEPWLNLKSRSEILYELATSNRAIIDATGQSPEGFRGPGFSLSTSILEALLQQGYRYDASTFPTYLGPLARTYYFLTAKFDREQREQRKLLFGGFSEGRRPLNPYRWSLTGGKLLELPVTTMPVLRIPFHLSYLHYLAGTSTPIAWAYFKISLALCRQTATAPSLLLHPLDFLGGDDVDTLKYFPGMASSSQTKLALIDRVLGYYVENFNVMPMRDYAGLITRAERLDDIEPSFPSDETATSQRFADA